MNYWLIHATTQLTFRCKRLSDRRLNQMTASSMTPLVYCCCCCLVALCQLSVTPWTVDHQAPLSIKFSSQEYWTGLPFPSPGDLPDPEIEQASPAWQVASLPLSCLGSPPLGWHARKDTKLQEWRTGWLATYFRA